MAGFRVSGIDFGQAYERSNVILALADIISHDIKNKPIIALHQSGSNSISDLNSVSYADKEKIIQGIKESAVDQSIKEMLLKLSKSAIAEEFNTMFALLEEKKRPVLYVRWILKDDELLMSCRNGNFGHFICLAFFYDHTGTKSILISNPNGHEIEDEHEAAAVSSYLENNSVKIYHTRDYLQFDDTFCSPGSLIALRILYNMDRSTFEGILQNGEQRQGYNFKYTSIAFGNDLLQKEIGSILQKNEQEKIAQVVRELDYETAALACKVLSQNNDISDVALPFTLNNIPFNQELLQGNFTESQEEHLSRVLLSGKRLIGNEQIQQVQQNRKEKLGELNKGFHQFNQELLQGNFTESQEEHLSRVLLSGKRLIDNEQIQQVQQNRKEKLGELNKGFHQSKINSKSYYVGCIAIGLFFGSSISCGIAYCAGATDVGLVIAVICGSLLGMIVGYGIAKICEKINEKKDGNPDMSTCAAVKDALYDVEHSKFGFQVNP